MIAEARPVGLAIVGWGAMSDLGHLPALQATTALTPTMLIDPDEGRAKSLARKFGAPHHSTRLAAAANHASAAPRPHQRGMRLDCERPSYSDRKAFSHVSARMRCHHFGGAKEKSRACRRYGQAIRSVNEVPKGLPGPRDLRQSPLVQVGEWRGGRTANQVFLTVP
jgi:hypothetical protein